MNDPIDNLLQEGWEIIDTDEYADTGDTIYTLQHKENKLRVFKVICKEVV